MKVTKKEMLNLLMLWPDSKTMLAIAEVIEKHVPDDPKPVWKPEEIKWFYPHLISSSGEVFVSKYTIRHEECLNTGFCRPNEADARYFFDQIVKPMSLIALRAYQLDPGWQVDWKDKSQQKWYVWAEYPGGEWCNSYTHPFKGPEFLT